MVGIYHSNDSGSSKRHEVGVSIDVAVRPGVDVAAVVVVAVDEAEGLVVEIEAAHGAVVAGRHQLVGVEGAERETVDRTRVRLKIVKQWFCGNRIVQQNLRSWVRIHPYFRV